MEELNPTAYVILGFLDGQPLSGYEIKALVDDSTRFFWAASYGQIYPELRRLAEAGLVEGKSRPQGGRKRTVYRLTAAGRSRLRAWLHEDPSSFELRDEGLLKLFFADAAEGRSAVSTLEAKRRHHEAVVDRLRQIEEQSAGSPASSRQVVLRYGIECNEWMARWCERTARELEAQRGAERRSA
jgi:PadR family transcriptional regulator, regulatory protein AphA